MEENLSKYICSYLTYLEKELGYTNDTIKSYEIDLKQYAMYLKLKKINFKNINKDTARDYLKYLDNLNLTNKSISRKLSSLRGFYNFLVDILVTDTNIYESISNPKVEKKLPEFLNYEEINNLLESVNTSTALGIRNRLLLELIYATGIRLSECANLKLSNINKYENSLKIFGKGQKERIVYYGEYAEKYLNLYLSESRDKLLNGKNSEYLFINHFGNQLHAEGIENVLKEQVKKISLKHKISIHTLRHTFATHLLNNGADIKTVQELLGHSSLATTEIYTHITSERVREVYNKTHPRNKK